MRARFGAGGIAIPVIAITGLPSSFSALGDVGGVMLPSQPPSATEAIMTTDSLMSSRSTWRDPLMLDAIYERCFAPMRTSTTKRTILRITRSP